MRAERAVRPIMCYDKARDDVCWSDLGSHGRGLLAYWYSWPARLLEMVINFSELKHELGLIKEKVFITSHL